MFVVRYNGMTLFIPGTKTQPGVPLQSVLSQWCRKAQRTSTRGSCGISALGPISTPGSWKTKSVSLTSMNILLCVRACTDGNDTCQRGIKPAEAVCGVLRGYRVLFNHRGGFGSVEPGKLHYLPSRPAYHCPVLTRHMMAPK